MKFKKILAVLSAILLTGSLASCQIWGDNGSSGSGNGNGQGCDGLPGKEEWTIDDVNKFLNDSENGPFDISLNANTVAIIPFAHINGPRKEWKFFALVNYEWDMTFYWRYQVTFLSCTCRPGEVNYWSTVYLELTTGNAGEDDIVIQNISFEKDGSDHYQAAFWGDSSPINNSSGGSYVAGEDDDHKTGEVTYEDIKTGFIEHLIGLTYGDIKDWSTEDDIDHTLHPEIGESLDKWSGASVSTNNIIRILQATIQYHIKQERI